MLLAVLTLTLCLASLASCGKVAGADTTFGSAMEKIRLFDIEGFSEYVSQAQSSYFAAVLSEAQKLSESGREALSSLYSGISWEITGVGDSYLNVKLVSFDFDKLSRYISDSYALGIGTGKAELLTSLVAGGKVSLSYGKTYEIKVKFISDEGTIQFPFDSAENSGLIEALGLSQMINLLAK